uniref:50S ribosomal protein L35 n=1 Tax=Eustigmatophyceae sp. Mont 10/10-1w TaxID=2506145 RepID=A0A451FMW8_9STRA|nr:ribosomal protein L35 [Eustigmatophyceae sp. Mont 10/10-1w]QAA11765.1 ribosomal protein L35 [Eustigmatophyceae sp. Mont 10/10-1w]
MKKKTRRSALKRYKKTGTNKFLRKRAYKSHLLVKKSSARKAKLSKPIVVSKTETKMLNKLFQ